MNLLCRHSSCLMGMARRVLSASPAVLAPFMQASRPSCYAAQGAYIGHSADNTYIATLTFCAFVTDHHRSVGPVDWSIGRPHDWRREHTCYLTSWEQRKLYGLGALAFANRFRAVRAACDRLVLFFLHGSKGVVGVYCGIGDLRIYPSCHHRIV